MEPPKSTDTRDLENNARMLRDAGASMLDISDIPMARMRMTGLAAAHKVQQATGLETVLHFPVRGRNLLRVQGDLLAAHALNVRNLFVTMGDPASIGDYPQAFDHHDIVPTGLVQLIKEQFNCGKDSAGSAIGPACTFVVGVAANLTPSDFDKEAKLLKKKIDCGADFALTQPVFDAKTALRFSCALRKVVRPADAAVAGRRAAAGVAAACHLSEKRGAGHDAARRAGRAHGAGRRAARDEGRNIAAEVLAEMRAACAGRLLYPGIQTLRRRCGADRARSRCS